MFNQKRDEDQTRNTKEGRVSLKLRIALRLTSFNIYFKNIYIQLIRIVSY